MNRSRCLPTLRLGAAIAAAALAAGCTTAPRPADAPERPADVRQRVQSLLPPALADRAGWAQDLQVAFSALGVEPSVENLCAAIAVAEQESGLRADPPVPRLGEIARRELEERAERAGVPRLAVAAALVLPSPDGRSWNERLAAVKTERELSDLYESFIDRVPLGRRFLASRNPVRTGGPMQVSVAFAERQAERGYPYPLKGSVRDEVFTRRGGLYFGVAHLLDYEAPYDALIYRYADFNAGRWASRNAAFQNALAAVTGIPLVPDGDLLPPDAGRDTPPGATETAARSLASRLGLDADDIRRELAQGEGPGFERSRLWQRVFALAERQGRRLPRAALPRITLEGPKIQRKLTTEWFARRVDERQRRCVARADSPA
ncbi:DUF1615 domain-containing protein [Rubrivivax sp. JA1024]|nr:DUF1615 domain-containing protein [Rubrivivax sp. JA1024]